MTVRLLRYLGTHLKRTGHVNGLVTQSAGLIDAGFEVCLVLSRPPDRMEWLEQLEQVGVRLEYIDRPRSMLDSKCLFKAVTLFRDFKPHIVHCENIHLIPLLAAKIAGVRGRIWHKRAMNSATEELRKITLHDKIASTTRLAAVLTRRIICVSRKVACELSDLGIQKNKLVVLNNPANGYERTNAGVDYSRREQFGLTDNDIVAVTIGHAVPVKGWTDLLKGFARIATHVPRLKLLLVGSTKDQHELSTASRLEEIIEFHGLRERVIFTGYIDSVNDALLTSDFFVLPSRAEGYCNALVEAFARNVPCISTRVGIAPELIENGVNGRLVNRGDIAGLATAMRDLALHSEARSSIRKKANWPDWILSYEQHTARLQEIYADVYQEILG